MTKTIINPKTGKTYNLTTKKGLEVLEKYYQQAGSSECGEYNNEPIKCHTHKTREGIQCLYKKKGDKEGICYKKSKKAKRDDIELLESDRRRKGSVSNQFKTSAKKMFKKALERNRIFNVSKNDREILKKIKEEDEKKLVEHCIPCLEDGLNMTEWDNRSCDACLNQDDKMDVYFNNHPEFSTISNRKQFSQYKKERQDYENKVRSIQEQKVKEMELAHTKQLCQTCDQTTNIDQWNENNCDNTCLNADEAFGYTKDTFKNRKNTFMLQKMNEENEKKIKLAVLRTKCEPCLETKNLSDWDRNNCNQCLEEDLGESFADKGLDISLKTFTEMKSRFEREEKERLESEQKRIDEIKARCGPCNNSTSIKEWAENKCDECVDEDETLGLSKNSLNNTKNKLEIEHQKQVIKQASEMAAKKAQCEPCIDLDTLEKWNNNECGQCMDDKAAEALQLSKDYFINKQQELEKENKQREHEKKVLLATQKAQCEPCYNTTDIQQWEENNCDECIDTDEAFGQNKGYFSAKKDNFIKIADKLQKEKEIKLAAQKQQCEPCVNSMDIGEWENNDCNLCLEADEALQLEDGTLSNLKINLEEQQRKKEEERKIKLENEKNKCSPCYNSISKEEWDNNNCDECLDSDEALGQTTGYMKNKKKDLVKKYLDEQLAKQLRLKEKEMTCNPCLKSETINDWNNSNCDTCIDEETAEIFNLTKGDIETYKNSLIEKDRKEREQEELRKVTIKAKCQPCVDSTDIDNWKNLNCDECLTSDIDIDQSEGYMKSIKDTHVMKRSEEELTKKLERETALATCSPCTEVKDISEWNTLNCDQCLEDKDWILEENIHKRNTLPDDSTCNNNWCLDCAGLECKEGKCVSPKSDTPEFVYTPSLVKKRLKNNKKNRQKCKKERIKTFSELKAHFEKMEKIRIETEELEKRRELGKQCSVCTESVNINDWNNNDCDTCINQEENYDSNLETGQIQAIKNKLLDDEKKSKERDEILSKCSNCGTENQSIDTWNQNDCDSCIGKDDIIYDNNPNKGDWKIGEPFPEGYITLEMYKNSRQKWEDDREKLKTQCDPCMDSENIDNWNNNNCDQCLDKEKWYDNNLDEGEIRDLKNDLVKKKVAQDEIEKVGKICKDKCSNQLSINEWNENDCDYCIDKDEIMLAHYNTSPGWTPGDDIPPGYTTFKQYKKSRQDWEDNARVLQKKCPPCLESNDLSNWEDNNCDQCLDNELAYDSDLETGDIQKFKNKLISEENERRLAEENAEKKKQCSPCNNVNSIDEWDKNNCDQCTSSDQILGLESNTLLSKKMDLQITDKRNKEKTNKKKQEDQRIKNLYSLSKQN